MASLQAMGASGSLDEYSKPHEWYLISDVGSHVCNSARAMYRSSPLIVAHYLAIACVSLTSI